MRTVTMNFQLTFDRPDDPVHYDDFAYPVVSDVLHQLAESELAMGEGEQETIKEGKFIPKALGWGKVKVSTWFHVDEEDTQNEYK